jgi:hypothetical protein
MARFDEETELIDKPVRVESLDRAASRTYAAPHPALTIATFSEETMMHPSSRLAAATIALIVFAIVLSAQNAADVTGKWLFAVETSAGGGMPTITLKQDGEKLTGHYSGQLGEADLTGSARSGQITFTFNINVQGMDLTCTYQGTVTGAESMKGTMDIAGVATGTFTAKRS